jgi:two-component system, OmpR family, response regulator
MAKRELARALVIVVDDDREFQRMAVDWLGQDYEVAAFSDGEELIEALPGMSPDLVILGMRTPGPNGFSLCRRLRADECLTGVPLLVLTASSEDVDFVRNMEGGGAWLAKPMSRSGLLSKVDELLGL